MNSKDFSALKQKAFTAYHQDGILDLVYAVVLLGFGTFMLTNNVVFLALGAIIAALYIPIKQQLTVPRFGFVRFESEKKSLTKAWILMGIGVLVLLIVFIARYFVGDSSASPDMQALTQQYHMVPLAGLLFGIPALFAFLYFKLPRFLIYGILTVALPALGGWMNIETYIPILSLGGLVLLISFIMMIRFRKRYPIIKEE